MEFTQLQYFMEVAESQHITASAEKLHIAQPALSMTIHRLEENLGVKLFEKRGRNIVLTECGRYLYSELQPIMNKLEALPEKMSEMKDTEGRTIRINVLAASAMVSDAIIEFKKNNPDVIVKLRQNENDNDCDIEITTKLFFQNRFDSNHVFSCPEEIFIAVPKNGKYGDKDSITLKEVENDDFICLSGSRQFRVICNKFCDIVGVSPSITFESDSPATVQNMITAGSGIGFWPSKSWGKIDDSSIKLLHISDPLCSRVIIVTDKCKSKKKYSEMFFDFIKGYIENLEVVEN